MLQEVIFQIIYQLGVFHISQAVSQVTFQMAFHKDLSLIFRNLEEVVFQVVAYHNMVLAIYQLVCQMACLIMVFQTAYLIIFQIIYLNRDHLALKEVYQIEAIYHMVAFQLFRIHLMDHQDSHMKVFLVNLMDLQMILVNMVIFNRVSQVYHRV